MKKKGGVGWELRSKQGVSRSRYGHATDTLWTCYGHAMDRGFIRKSGPKIREGCGFSEATTLHIAGGIGRSIDDVSSRAFGTLVFYNRFFQCPLKKRGGSCIGITVKIRGLAARLRQGYGNLIGQAMARLRQGDL